jgi:hypothetical protein
MTQSPQGELRVSEETSKDTRDSASVGGSESPAPLKPYQRWRHPPGCPDSDWCSGNGMCYWDCQEDGSYWNGH